MVTYTDKQVKHWDAWEGKRNRKWFYIFKNGVLIYGWPVVAMNILFNSYRSKERWDAIAIAIHIGVWTVAGIFWGLWFYRTQEKGYKSFLKNRVMGDGGSEAVISR